MRRTTLLRKSATAWVFAATPLAAWEVLMRLDTQVASSSLKLLLFVLLSGGLICLVVFFGVAVDSCALRTSISPRAQTHLRSIVLAGFCGLSACAEYVGLTHYHAIDYTRFWPAAFGVGAVFGLALCATHQQQVGAAGKSRGHSLIVTWAAVGAFGCVSALSIIVVLRADAAACILKANTIVGRVYGAALSRFPLRFDQQATAPSRKHDLRLADPYGQSDVVLITIDTLRTDFLSAYNRHAKATPSFDKLSREGILFDSVFAQRPTSAPSMATILTGLYPAHHGVRQNTYRLADDVTTLAEILSLYGYKTAGFVTNVNFARTFGFNQGFETYHYIEASRDADGLITDDSDIFVVDEALEWLSNPTQNPVFLWVHLSAPHSPYLPPFEVPLGFSGMKGGWFNVWNMPEQLARTANLNTYFHLSRYFDLYAAEVQLIDAQLGRLRAGLERIGRFDSAQIIFTADHGEAFGEADSFGHGRSLDPAETRVPLTWKLPRIGRENTRISMPLQLADIFPSLLSMLGISLQTKSDGRDISALVAGEAKPDRGFAFTEAGYKGWLGTRGLKYAARDARRAIWVDTGFSYEVEFDRVQDPNETKWLARSPSANKELRESLLSLAAESESQLRHATGPQELTPGQKERLRALGYVQ